MELLDERAGFAHLLTYCAVGEAIITYQLGKEFRNILWAINEFWRQLSE